MSQYHSYTFHIQIVSQHVSVQHRRCRHARCNYLRPGLYIGVYFISNLHLHSGYVHSIISWFFILVKAQRFRSFLCHFVKCLKKKSALRLFLFVRVRNNRLTKQSCVPDMSEFTSPFMLAENDVTPIKGCGFFASQMPWGHFFLFFTSHQTQGRA